MTILRFLLVLALGCAPLAVLAEPVIAVDNANPPFMYRKDGRPHGLYPVLLDAVFKRAEIDVVIRTMPWKRALRSGENGKVGIGGIYKNAQRLEIFDYSRPLFDEKLLVYVPDDKVFVFNDIADLYGKKVGVIRGWSYTEALDQAISDGRIEALENSSDEANFKMLASGRLDAVIAIELAGQKLIKQLRLNDTVALSRPLSINPTYLVFAKKAKQQALLRQFDETLKAMEADGSLDALVQQVIGEP
ncbi:substrate-binding periplasmic protein [Pseudomonas borbori]